MTRPRFWRAAWWFGAAMAFLYFLEVAKLATIVLFNVPVGAVVMERHDSEGASVLFYRYEVAGQPLHGTKVYRFPERLFVKGLSEGELFDVLAFSAYPEWSTPRKFIFPEVFLSLGWLTLACLVVMKSSREIAVQA